MTDCETIKSMDDALKKFYKSATDPQLKSNLKEILKGRDINVELIQ